MKSPFVRSLFAAFLLRVTIAAAVAGAVLALRPPLIVGALIGFAAAVWAAWMCRRAVLRGTEALEAPAALIGDSAFEETGLAPPRFNDLDPLHSTMVSAHGRASLRLAESLEMRRKLEGLLDSMQDAVVSVDAAGRIIWANRPMQRVAAESFATVRPGHALVQTIRAPEVLAAVETALERGAVSHPQRITLPGRTFMVEASPMPHGGAVVVLREVTRIEQVERQQRDFVANVSHELRTPLTTINGYVESLLDDDSASFGFNDAGREFLEAIAKSARRMERLTNDLMVMARVESNEQKLRPSPVEAGVVIYEAVEAVSGLFREKGGELEFGPIAEVEVLADVDAIVQVMSNLIENALNYGRGPRGAIVVLAAEPAGEEVMFSVRDFGQGIASEHIDRLFERFYRVDKARSVESGGTGLGLAIARHVVEEHRGRIWVESGLGRGSRFCFTLPRVASSGLDEDASDATELSELDEDDQL